MTEILGTGCSTLRLSCSEGIQRVDLTGIYSCTFFATASDRWQVHGITSSARRRRDGGIVMPSALAVLRLRPSLHVVGCCTGTSASFAPLRILSTKTAAARNEACRSAA